MFAGKARNVSRYVPSSVIGEVEENKEMELLKSLEDSKTVFKRDETLYVPAYMTPLL